MLSKYTLFGIILQCMFLSLVSASESAAQKTMSVREVYPDIELHDANIYEAFKLIESKTNFRFNFEKKDINGNVTITLLNSKKSVADILLQISKEASLRFRQVNNNINVNKIRSEKDRKAPKLEVVLDGITVTGRITSSDDQSGLPGVNVVVKGTSQGTVTDLDGNYKIDVPNQESVLVFSSVGYLTEETTVGSRTVISLVLTPDVKSLQEIVVIGYGEVEKKDVTGAIGSIQSEDITRANPVQTARALQGQVAGVNVSRVNSQPGADYSIDIRGLSSIDKSNAPLVVIDGVMGGNLNTLNPSDIASMDVLKDASATAIYGSRGANGVVIITTKKGKEGKAKVTYDGYVGVKVPSHLPDMMTAQQFHKAYTTDRLLDGGKEETFTSTEMALINSGQSTDWIDDVTSPGPQTSHVVAVSGGSANTTYYFSGGYLNESGNLINTDYNRYNIKGSVDSKITNAIKVGFSAYYTYSIQNLGSNEALRSAYRARPTGVPYFADVVNPAENNDLDWNGYAVWMGINDHQVLNPIVEGDAQNFKHETRASDLLANGYLEITPFKGLSLKSSLSALTFNDRVGDYRGTFTKSQKTTRKPKAEYDTDNRTSYTWDNILTYKLALNKHNFNITAVQSAFEERRESSGINVQDLPYRSVWYNLGTAATINGVSSNLTERTLLSYMGRFNYSFDDKYIFTVTGRWDGSSVLAEGHKWAFFPSAALAWRMDEEAFIKNMKLFSNLKLRLSYGMVGNDAVDPYSTQANLINTPYDFDGAPAYGFAPATIANEDLKWEKSQEVNLGLDLGFVNNRIMATIEMYNRKTVDLILNQKIPTSSGFGDVTSNVGQVLNRGIEVTLNTVNINTSDFSWNTSLNFSANHNEILELYGGDVTVDKGNKLFVGESLHSNYYYKFDGIWQSDEADEATKYGQKPGSVKVVDQNNDGKISSADEIDDRVVLGSELPKWLAGMTNTLTFKNWDFSFFIYTRQGVQYRNSMLSGTFGELSSGRYNHLDLNYWTPENPTNDYFGVTVSQPYREAIQYQDASFVRISDITLGYKLPQTILDRWHVGTLRVYGQVNNPFVFTKFVSFDPEYNSSTYNDDVPSTAYLFGVNLSF